MEDYQKGLIEISLEKEALSPVPTELKSGRVSPYFFNAGKFSDGRSALRLADYYASAIYEIFDPDESYVLYGPSMKGTLLVPTVALLLEENYGVNVNFSSNRQIPKDHGEGTVDDYQKKWLIGYYYRGGEKVLLLDDVVTTGKTKLDSISKLKNIPNLSSDLEFVGIMIMLDRQEVDDSERSASEKFKLETGIPVNSIIGAGNVYEYLCEPEVYDDEILFKRETYLSNFGLTEEDFRRSMKDYLGRYGTLDVRKKIGIS